MLLKQFRSAMTLMEIMMVVVLVGILSTLAIANYSRTIANARQREARSLLLLIQHAEEVVRVETNAYLPCGSTATCNTDLRLNLPDTATWTYTATSGDPSCFCATATSGVGLPTWRIRNDWTEARTTGCACP